MGVIRRVWGFQGATFALGHAGRYGLCFGPAARRGSKSEGVRQTVMVINWEATWSLRDPLKMGQ